MKLFIVLAFLVLSLSAFSQNTFQELIHTTQGGELIFMRESEDGGQLMSGIPLPVSHQLFSKTDSVGNIDFCKIIYLPTSSTITDFITNSSGYKLICDYGTHELNIFQTDFNGIVQSGITYSANMTLGEFHDIKFSDGSVILTGNKGVVPNREIFEIKLDSTGAVMWSKRIVAPRLQGTSHIIDDGSTNFYFNNYLPDTASASVFPVIIKCDSSGNLIWARQYNFEFQISGIDKTSDHGLICSGMYMVGPDVNSLLIKIDSLGIPIWSKGYADSTHFFNSSDVKNAYGNGFILTGVVKPNLGQNAFSLKTDISGNILWSYEYGGPSLEYVRNVCLTPDSGFAFAGSTNGINSLGYTTGYLARTDSLGHVGCFENPLLIDTLSIQITSSPLTFNVSSTPVSVSVPTLPFVSNDSGYIVCGHVNWINEEVQTKFELFPNPADNLLVIKNVESPDANGEIELYTMMGQLVKKGRLEGEKTIINVSDLPEGIYFCTISGRSVNGKMKFVVLH